MGSIPRNNIYDMGGNVLEWTTEVYGRQGYQLTLHGGLYSSNASDYPAGTRGNYDNVGSYIGFRSTLFVGL